MRVNCMRLKFIRPMEPELLDIPPEGDDWSHEIKFDGYRTQVIRDDDGIRMLTKNGFDWTARYRRLRRSRRDRGRKFHFRRRTIVINEAGLFGFHALQGIVGRRRPSPDLYLVASIFCSSMVTICATWRWRTVARSWKE